MKRYIHAATEVSILDLIDKIDVVAIVGDARTRSFNQVPIAASKRNDDLARFEMYLPEEFMDEDISTLRRIESPYALANLLIATKDYGFDYKFTGKQKDILSKYLDKRENSIVRVSDEDVNRVLNLIKRCDTVTGPDFRYNEKEKNFAKVHGLRMVEDDYLNIIKMLTAKNFMSAIMSSDVTRLGTILFEFTCKPKYKLKYSDQVINGDIDIYIKILPDYHGITVTLISFHDKLDDEHA